MGITLILVSPLTRAMETAEIVFKDIWHKVPVVCVELVREKYGGVIGDKRSPVSVLKARFPHVVCFLILFLFECCRILQRYIFQDWMRIFGYLVMLKYIHTEKRLIGDKPSPVRVLKARFALVVCFFCLFFRVLQYFLGI
jgi:hypothetical protein